MFGRAEKKRIKAKYLNDLILPLMQEFVAENCVSDSSFFHPLSLSYSMHM